LTPPRVFPHKGCLSDVYIIEVTGYYIDFGNYQYKIPFTTCGTAVITDLADNWNISPHCTVWWPAELWHTHPDKSYRCLWSTISQEHIGSLYKNQEPNVTSGCLHHPSSH